MEKKTIEKMENENYWLKEALKYSKRRDIKELEMFWDCRFLAALRAEP